MKVLIIEDEIPAAERLRDMVQKYDPNIEIEGPLDSNEVVINWFGQNPAPNLVFSDIELLDGPVFYSLERIDVGAPIIFTTAYDQYALDAFKTNGISYLLKPFEWEHFSSAMDKFQDLKKNFQGESNAQLIEDLKAIRSGQHSTYRSKLNIKMGQGMYLLNVKDIACVRTEHGQVQAFKADGKKIPLSNLISELQDELNPASFFRINRSEIVNANFIEKIEPYFNDRLAVTIRGQKAFLITSAAKTPEFRKWLNQL